MNDNPITEVTAQWTIKGMPRDERMRVVAAAKRSGMSVAEWVRSALRLHLDPESDIALASPSPPLPANDEAQRPSREVSSSSRLDDEERQEMRERIGLLEGQCASLSRRLDRLSRLLDTP